MYILQNQKHAGVLSVIFGSFRKRFCPDSAYKGNKCHPIERTACVDVLYQDARQIIETARSNAVRSVDFCRVKMYWNLGKRILEEEQQGTTLLFEHIIPEQRHPIEYGAGKGLVDAYTY